MTPHRNFKVFLAVALGVIAVLALPALAAAKAKDRNHDGIPDRWEHRHHLSLRVNQAHRDQDGDHLRNLAEFQAGDNPRNPDTDGDGIPDGEENAGTIQSFDPETGKLTISLFSTETISGLVTEQTEIKCESEHSAASASDSHHGGDNPGEDESQSGDHEGDNSGPGSPNSGDDEGESGDDNDGNANCTTADLTPGAVVQQADLQVENGAATFEEVELAG